jgi:hypothetical protein
MKLHPVVLVEGSLVNVALFIYEVELNESVKLLDGEVDELS